MALEKFSDIFTQDDKVCWTIENFGAVIVFEKWFLPQPALICRVYIFLKVERRKMQLFKSVAVHE